MTRKESIVFVCWRLSRNERGRQPTRPQTSAKPLEDALDRDDGHEGQVEDRVAQEDAHEAAHLGQEGLGVVGDVLLFDVDPWREGQLEEEEEIMSPGTQK